MSGLTPEEQRFFETGDLSSLTNADPQPDPGPGPLELAALANPEPKVEPVAPIDKSTLSVAPKPDSVQLPDVAEIQRRNLADAQQRVAELELKFKQAEPKPQVDPEPDPQVDPLGSMMHKLSTLTKQIEAMQTQQQQSTQTQQQLSQFQVFQQNVQSLRDQFAKTQPDFEAAYTHLREARVADLKTFGLNEKQIQETMFREEVALAESAINSGKNPAQTVYEMAKRHGYVPKPTTPSKPDPVEIARAQAAAKSLPTSTPSSELDLTLEAVRNASDADLNKLVLDKATWAKLVGADDYPL